MNTQTSLKNLRLPAASFLAATFALATLPLHAADYTWTGGAGSGSANRNWDLSANWSATPAFTRSNNILFGSASGSSLAAPSYIGASRSINTLIFTSGANNDLGIRLSATTGNTGRLLIVGDDNGGGVTVNAGSAGNHTIGVDGLGTFRIYSGITIPLVINHNGAGNLTIAAGIDEGAAGKSIKKTGSGTLTFSNINHYTGNTIVSAGTLNLTSSSELRFVLGDGGVSNNVSGVGAVNLNGILRIDSESLSGTSGSWQLVDVNSLTATFNSVTFGLAFMDGPAFANAGAGIYTSGDWTFDTGTGVLTLGAIPEPATMAFLLAAVALATVTIFRRR